MGTSFPSEQTMGAAYKGFNDTLASWGSNRIMGQQCGQTWLQTFSDFNTRYSAGKELPALQLVTWNDYEEGTEIESGIDNCLSLSGTVAANTLQWTIKGNADTIDHYTAYVSSDGQNLAPLTDIAAGTHSLDLCGFTIPNGNYRVFVQAAGKPGILNQISGAIPYESSCITAVPPPTLSFMASPSRLTIPAGQSRTLRITAKTQSGSFNNPLALSVSGCPITLNCSFSVGSVTPKAGAASSVLTISTAPLKSRNLPEQRKLVPIYFAWLMPIGIAGFAFAGKGTRQRGAQVLALVAIFGMGMFVTSCGGMKSGFQNSSTAAGNYSLTIHGNSSDGQFSTAVNVTIQ
jgi:hypothetical protein